MTGSGILYRSRSVTLTPDTYPSTVPAVTGVTFSNGVFYVDPAANVTLNFSAFSDYAHVGVVSLEGPSIQDQSSGGSSLKQDVLSVANPFVSPSLRAPFSHVCDFTWPRWWRATFTNWTCRTRRA